MEALKLAIQKSGRLSEKSLQLLNQCGIRLPNGSRKLKTRASNFPLEILFLRDDDIPEYIEKGVADLGILGENEVLEQGRAYKTRKKLGFAKCRLSLAIARETDYSGTDFFQGKRIATSYPGILKSFLENQGLDSSQISIEQISGSVEIAPSIGLADAIFDIVSTGSTLVSNGLKEVEQVMQSEAILIGQEETSAAKEKLIEELIFRIKSVQEARKAKYILLNAPNKNLDQISALIPGMKSPTVLPLAEENWSSLHSVVYEDEFWEVVDQLKGLGAEGILVCAIEKMIL
jgi:ATP phosphoribosyltransferase